MNSTRHQRFLSALGTGAALMIGACVDQDHTNSGADYVAEVVPVCLAPVQNQGYPIRATDMVGEFDLVLHVSTGVERDSVVQGRIVLAKQSDTDDLPGVLWGWTTVSEERIGEIKISTALSSRVPSQPGVIGLAGRDGMEPVLLMGASGEGGVMARHAGVILHEIRGAPDGFRGMWEALTGDTGRATGFFCARRVEEHR